MGDDSSSLGILEETSISTENEDELADKLLTQFPVYGSAEQYASSSEHNDWLDAATDLQRGENDSDFFLEESLLSGDYKKGAATGTPASPSVSATAVTNAPSLDWDEDEQELWKQKSDATDLNETNTPGARSSQKRSSFSTSTATIPTSLAGIAFLSLPNAQANRNISQVNENDEQLLLENDDRQHWMPDKICKQCYACELPFTGKPVNTEWLCRPPFSDSDISY